MNRAEGVDWTTRKTTGFDRAAAARTVVILPVGSTEQHGPHLPVNIDTLLANEVARRGAAKAVAQGADVLVLPALWVSLAEHHMAFCGTLTLDFDAFRAVLTSLVNSLERQGHRRILLLNGHGGNTGALPPIVDGLSRGRQATVATATYWNLAAPAFGGILEGQGGLLHACEAETSMALHLVPELVDLAAARRLDAPRTGFLAPDGIYRHRGIEHWSCSGVVGTPALASADKGRRLLEAASDALAARLVDGACWD